MKSHLLSFIVVLLSFIASANASVLRGKITDENGEALPFATVLVVGTTYGTSANGTGQYILDLNPGTYSIKCQYMGYETSIQQIELKESNHSLDFVLKIQTMEMEGVTIKADGEDPAYAIMRKVIERRKYHESLIKTFETEIYLKGVLRMRSVPKKILGQEIAIEDLQETGVDSLGKGVLYLLEELSEYSFKAPSKEYNKVISVRQSGDPKGLGWATMPPIINIYENNINILSNISPRGFISPANSNAFQFYRFKFLGSFVEDNRMINKIQVIPKRKYEPLFSGYVYVVDEEWVFQSVDLLLTSTSQLQVLDTLRFEQNYMRIEKDVWVIQNQVLYPTLTVLGFDISGNFVTSYSNQQVNHPIDDARFSSKIVASYDSAANSRSIDYWDTIRPIPLEEDEIKDYKLKDSLYTEEQKSGDSVQLKTNSNTTISGFILGTPTFNWNKNSISFNSLINSISYNSVEGVNATLGVFWQNKISSNQSLNVSLWNRYGFVNNHYNPLLKLSFLSNSSSNKGKNLRFNLQGGQFVYQLNQDNPISNIMNMGYTLLGGLNYMKLYENRHIKLEAIKKWGNGLEASASLSYEKRMSLDNASLYAFNKNNLSNLTSNQPEELPLFQDHIAAIAHVSIHYQPGWKYIQYPTYLQPLKSRAPIFSLYYTKGFAGIGNSNSNFDKWEASISHQFKMNLLGQLDYRLVSGGFLNKSYVGIPDMKHLFGNKTFLANPYLKSFQLAPYYKFSNTADIYLQAHAEWHLGGLLTNKIPLFKRLNWYLVGGANTLFINENQYYAEVFVGLENIGWKFIRFGRVDFIAGYESGKTKPSLGVRVSIGDVFWNLLNINTNRGE